jgi:hypothetical protein
MNKDLLNESQARNTFMSNYTASFMSGSTSLQSEQAIDILYLTWTPTAPENLLALSPMG